MAAIIIFLLGAGLLLFVNAIVRGFVLSILWGWFLVPLGVPAVGVAGAIGVALVIGMLTEHLKNQDSTEDVGVQITVSLLSPFFILLLGYIVHSFM